MMAQSDISMTTHWNNRANYNPAFIARTDYLYLFSNARYQWFGVNGSPKVFNIQASEYINKMHSAFGLSLVADKIGLTQVYNPMISYAYRIDNKKGSALAFGLSAGVFTRTIEGNQFEAETMNDPSVEYQIKKEINPDANVGIEFQGSKFIWGISSTHLFSIGSSINGSANANHRYGYFIYKNNYPDLIYYKLGILVTNRNNLTVAEGNIFLRFKHPTGLMRGPRELFETGISVKSTRQAAFLFGIMLTPNLRLGYAYEHNFINSYSKNNTHEIMIEYRIFNTGASTRMRCGKDLFWYH